MGAVRGPCLAGRTTACLPLRAGIGAGTLPDGTTRLSLDGETIYAFDQPGQLRAVDLKTGKRLWGTLAPLSAKKDLNSGTGFLVKNGKLYWIFTENGELILCKLGREKYEEIGRAKLLEPTGPGFGRDVVWSHPAFANKCVYARNDKEIVCASMAREQK